MSSDTERPDAELLASLQRAGLLRDPTQARFVRLTGGVSSDIWQVTEQGRSICVKRALSRLKVAAEWMAPVERNRYEVAWFREAGRVLPQAVPQILHEDDEAMLCAMTFLDPAEHLLWKHELRDGRVRIEDARAVGSVLGRIHAGTADRPDLAAVFPRADIFQAIRLEPYLEATATRHPDLHAQLFALSRRTAAIRRVLIHGDVSPKNILIGPHGPVMLDAECACLGDPAFDLAFCLNHLLLKCLWHPPATDALLASFAALAQAYLAEVDWEPPAELEGRAASLLPGLLLARVDGKSPVEYLQAEADRNRVRRVARALLFNPPQRLAQVAACWQQELAR
ncbi:MAG: phosphotransferase [Burkholderiaceae bacterium]